MVAARVTSKGQITIPKEIRTALGLECGDQVVFRLQSNGSVEFSREALDLPTLRGMLKPRRQGVTVEAMERAIARGATGS